MEAINSAVRIDIFFERRPFNEIRDGPLPPSCEDIIASTRLSYINTEIEYVDLPPVKVRIIRNDEFNFVRAIVLVNELEAWFETISLGVSPPGARLTKVTDGYNLYIMDYNVFDAVKIHVPSLKSLTRLMRPAIEKLHVDIEVYIKTMYPTYNHG